jgi:hypothetical protein
MTRTCTYSWLSGATSSNHSELDDRPAFVTTPGSMMSSLSASSPQNLFCVAFPSELLTNFERVFLLESKPSTHFEFLNRVKLTCSHCSHSYNDHMNLFQMCRHEQVFDSQPLPSELSMILLRQLVASKRQSCFSSKLSYTALDLPY